MSGFIAKLASTERGPRERVRQRFFYSYCEHIGTPWRRAYDAGVGMSPMRIRLIGLGALPAGSDSMSDLPSDNSGNRNASERF